MDTREKLVAALENSVHWYDALCEAHAVPGEHHPAYWINWGTIRDGAHAEAQLEGIRSLLD